MINRRLRGGMEGSSLKSPPGRRVIFPFWELDGTRRHMTSPRRLGRAHKENTPARCVAKTPDNESVQTYPCSADDVSVPRLRKLRVTSFLASCNDIAFSALSFGLFDFFFFFFGYTDVQLQNGSPPFPHPEVCQFSRVTYVTLFRAFLILPVMEHCWGRRFSR